MRPDKKEELCVKIIKRNGTEADFDIEKIKQYFDKDKFFIKISPINPNATCENNGLGSGVVDGINLI